MRSKNRIGHPNFGLIIFFHLVVQVDYHMGKEKLRLHVNAHLINEMKLKLYIAYIVILSTNKDKLNDKIDYIKLV